MIVGLTGSIASGKSEVARLLRERGIAVFDADASVHELYEQPQLVAAIGALFPEAVISGRIDRSQLSAALAGQPEGFAALERLVHPLVREQRRAFLARWKDESIVVLDIPLLFETNSENEMDVTVVVITTPELQRARAMARPGMTEKKLEMILSRQMPMAEKAKRADFVINNSGSLEDLAREVDMVLKQLRRSTEGAKP